MAKTFKNCVTHYNDGRPCWRLGASGYFARVRSSVSIAVLTLATMGVPWWWPEKYFPPIPEENFSTYAHMASILGATLFAGSIYLRRRSVRSLAIKRNLHNIAHTTRDFQAKLRSTGRTPKNQRQNEVTAYLQDICNLATEHFGLLTGEKEISACIRLASTEDSESDLIYKTYARSSALNSKRMQTTEPLSVSNSIIKMLREEKNSQGAIVFKDLNQAESENVYEPTKNDKNYPNDVRAMIVAPLNDASSNHAGMLGIIFINSGNTGTFEGKHVDALGFIADTVASCVSNTFHHFDLQDNYENARKKLRQAYNQEAAKN